MFSATPKSHSAMSFIKIINHSESEPALLQPCGFTTNKESSVIYLGEVVDCTGVVQSGGQHHQEVIEKQWFEF